MPVTFSSINKVVLTLLFLVFSNQSLAAPKAIPDLPEAVSNNAVAQVKTEQGTYLVSFMGLGRNKDYQAVHNKVWRYRLGDNSWQASQPVPSSLPLKGRLASIAATVKDQVYLFGGYTVAKDHSEISSPDNYRYSVTADQYKQIANTPVPVDDAVALTYQDRYIYLISGWHNDGNVNLVQVYDSQDDSWLQASPFPGKPVFGHAGGVVENKMLICDGVAVRYHAHKRRDFHAESACYLGTIDPQNLLKIDWRKIRHPTGTARYRMAAAGINNTPEVIFVGGSTNPYNYDGIGYDGEASSPDPHLWRYDLQNQRWQVSPTKTASMDHRGLIQLHGQLWTIGGMGKNQRVQASVTQVELEQAHR